MTRDAYLRAILNNVPYLIWLKDRDGRFLAVSDLFARSCGRQTAEEVIGKTDVDVWPADLANKYRSDDAEVMASRQHKKTEEQIAERTGTKWFETFKTPIFDENGEVIGTTGVAQDITERRRVDDLLRHESAFNQATLDSLPGLFYLFDSEGRFLRLNKNFERVSGYSAEEIARMTALDFFAGTDKDSVAEAIQRVFQTAEASVEVTFLSKDHTETPYLFTGKRFQFDQKSCVIGMGIDITERKRAEVALRDRQARYEAMVRSINDAVISADTQGQIVSWNPGAERIFGYSKDEILGQSIESLIPDRYRASHVAGMARVASGGARHVVGTTVELEARRKDGQEVPISMSLSEWQAREAKRFTAIIHDVTERARAEAALKASELRYRRLFEAAQDGVLILDADTGMIVDVNPFLVELMGFSRESFFGKTVWDLGFFKDIIANKDSFDKLQAEGYVRYDDKPLEAKDGHRIDVEFVSNVYLVDGHKVIQCNVRDITGRKYEKAQRASLEVQLQQAQKMESVGRLAGGVAHDFNNMLGVILGNTELAIEQVDPTHPLHADLVEIRNAAVRSADLTRQLLAFARKQTVAPEVLNLNEAVADMLKMLHRLIGENIHLKWQPREDLWPVKVDPSQIDQILANLCVNARDAISGVGKMTIETGNSTFDEGYSASNMECAPGDYVLLAVSDDGCGMDKETLLHLFEPFFTTKEVGQGTGLGLATVYGIVKQNNGFINVYSEPNQGTTFRIYLPRYMGAAEQARAGSAAEALPRGHETILLVEDEPAILKLAKRLLERQGYTVLAASTPGEAIRLAKEHSGEIHLLMTDVVMPEMNGRVLAKNLLSLYPHLKRLFMSGYTADVIAHHGVLDEGVQFIQKPFSTEALATKVREALNSDHD